MDWYLGALRNFVPEAWGALTHGASESLLARYFDLLSGEDGERALRRATDDMRERLVSAGTR